MSKTFYISEGSKFENKVSLKSELVSVSEEEFNQLVKKLEGYVLRIDYTRTSSYDNSDDDRVEDSYSSSSSYVYRLINPYENSQYLLRIDGEIVGVVFVIDNKTRKPYLFDGSYKSYVQLGYSASHSSTWTYIDKVTLVKKSKIKCECDREVNFKQNGTYPSL